MNTRQHVIWAIQTTHVNIALPLYGMINRQKKNKKPQQPKFAMCCMEGRMHLPFLTQPPAFLKYLLGQESGKMGINMGINYRKSIRVYSSMFAFTSMGGRVD